jgi:predicted nuclease of restriction endonuclease-like (RecB) superfamily
MNEIINLSDYRDWLNELKIRIKSSQIKAALSVNKELIALYWDLGRQISEKQQMNGWGSQVVNRLSQDLCSEFTGNTGFSRSNLYAMKQFYEFFHQLGGQFEETGTVEIVHQLGGQFQLENSIPEIVEKYCFNIPWRHIVLLLQKIKNKTEMLFYLNATIENNWSRNILNIQIESGLYKRRGKAVTNFFNILPMPQADLLNETLKNPYNFDFMTLDKNVRERELERGLVANISKLLMEMGKGFAFLGEQYQLTINKKDYFLDLLFYHVRLHCYVVVELKIGEFEPEYLGKMNFYLSAVDSLLKTENDNQTIGILLCKNQNSLDVEFALRDINKPIGVSEFSFKELPAKIQDQMPSAEELNNELLNFERNHENG